MPSEIQAVIFDMDGVLADTQRVHAQVESGMLAEMGIEISHHVITARFAGTGMGDQFRTVLKENGITFDEAQITHMVEEKERRYWEDVKRGVREIEGSVDLVTSLKAQNIPVAVATSSNRRMAEHVLGELDITQHIDALVPGDEVERSKPAPDIFLKASRQLNMPPQVCVVIEDGISGVFRAKKAEMKVIGIGQAVRGLGDYSVDHMSEAREILKGLLESGL